MSASEPGLRELKKQMTRRTIANAALQLTLDKGLDGVTVEEIAQLAFVSPRTVSNYFSNKEEAVVAAGTPDWLSVVDQFAGGPHTERPLATLRALFSDFVEAREAEELRLAVQTTELVDRHASLRPCETAAYDALEAALRERIEERTETDSETEVYPWLVAAAAVSAVRSAMRLWARSGAEPGQLPELIRTAFDQFIDGLPAPSPPRT
ncbi:TetR family transcriptional regulator [Georgenia halophila]|uniref:TetR family transcriptional regulator n=2 Tax=Georgenia halophila TaxID=620889 RepID=A0ABP8LBH7_9MICO